MGTIINIFNNIRKRKKMFKLILVLALAGPAFANYGNYGEMPAAPVRAPVLPPREPVNMNPCTEQVMRAMEIQLFAHPEDETKYIICTDIGIYVTMPCSPGTIFDKNLKHCIPVGWEAPLCPVGTCLNQADCFLNELGSPKCNCRLGFSGERCETNIDECAIEGNAVCSNQGGVCVDQVNAFYCVFDMGATIGFTQETKIRAPCTLVELAEGKQFYELPSPQKNVYVQCTGENQFTVSRCADMLFWHQELRTCSIERPIEKTGVCLNYPCKNDGECLDLGGNNFECKCKTGFEGALCESSIDFCLNRPCGSGRCVSHTGGYNCVCPNQIVAQSCDMEMKNPCTPETKYAPCKSHSDMYFSCALGLAYLKTCAPGLLWNQETLTCVLMEQPKRPMMTFPQRTMLPSFESVAPVNTPSSYGSYQTVTMPPMPPREPVFISTTPAPYAPVPETTPFFTPPRRTPATPSYGSYQTVTMPPRFAPQMPKPAPQPMYKSFMPSPPRMPVMPTRQEQFKRY